MRKSPAPTSGLRAVLVPTLRFGYTAVGSRRGMSSAHKDEREDQNRPSAKFITNMAEHECADRPRDITDAESRQSQQDPGRRIITREENFAKDQGGCGPIDKEIVIFQRAADPAGDRRFLGSSYPMWLVWVPSLMGVVGRHSRCPSSSVSVLNLRFDE